MKITKYYNRLALHFECGVLTSVHWQNVYAHITYKKRCTLTDYYTIIETGCLYTERDEALPLTPDKYLWLLRWKKIVYQWRYSLPITFNPSILIPRTPPKIKTLSLHEKKIIKKLKGEK